MTNCYIIEYIWIDGSGCLRSKTRVLYNQVVSKIEDVPFWSYDGSSCGQADVMNSEIFITPVAMHKNPFRQSGIIVLCEARKEDFTEAKGNNYTYAKQIFDKYSDQHPWYGLEQEFFITNPNEMAVDDCSTHYCGIGNHIKYRELLDKHLEYCLFAGIQISGNNIEVATNQYEFQIGPVEGIHAANQLWIARYILERLAEAEGLSINYEPKPFDNLNGSGCHANFSTQKMREDDGITEIEAAINKLGEKHREHLLIYGEGNEKRMTGENETSRYDKFSYGCGSRNTSVRIPIHVSKSKKGYFEDRRPGANCDPYLVTAKILETINN